MPRRFARASSGTVLVGPCLALVLAGCGGATPAAQTPAEVAVVDVDAAQVANGKTKGEDGKTAAPAGGKAPLDAHAARKKALEEAAEYGMIGLLGAGDGVPGGVVGGVLGGSSATFGSGGLGLSGVGVGGGGTGASIGLGSIGTIGHGGGGVGYGVVGSSSGSPVSGQAIHVAGGTVIELGDSVTLGVSLEAAARVLRERVYKLRDCYSKALAKNKQLAGSVAFRLVIGREGRVVLARELGSDLPDGKAVACMLEAMDDAYVTYPTGTFFGVIETVVRFSPKP
jgi:hypothetical protein